MNETNHLLTKVQRQIQLMEQAEKEASTWSVAFVDPEILSLLKRIEEELKNTRNG